MLANFQGTLWLMIAIDIFDIVHQQVANLFIINLQVAYF